MAAAEGMGIEMRESTVAKMISGSRGHNDGVVDSGEPVSAKIHATKESHLRNRSKHLRAHVDGHGSAARQDRRGVNEVAADGDRD